MHTTSIKEKLASYLKLLHRHRGELVGAYDEVSAIYDDFARVLVNSLKGGPILH